MTDKPACKTCKGSKIVFKAILPFVVDDMECEHTVPCPECSGEEKLPTPFVHEPGAATVFAKHKIKQQSERIAELEQGIEKLRVNVPLVGSLGQSAAWQAHNDLIDALLKEKPNDT